MVFHMEFIFSTTTQRPHFHGLWIWSTPSLNPAVYQVLPQLGLWNQLFWPKIWTLVFRWICFLFYSCHKTYQLFLTSSRRLISPIQTRLMSSLIVFNLLSIYSMFHINLRYSDERWNAWILNDLMGIGWRCCRLWCAMLCRSWSLDSEIGWRISDCLWYIWTCSSISICVGVLDNHSTMWICNLLCNFFKISFISLETLWWSNFCWKAAICMGQGFKSSNKRL